MRSLVRYGADRRARRAFDARLELVKAGLTRRDLVRMGLMTGGGVGGGLLVAEKSLARDLRSPNALGALPPLTPFVEPLTVLPALPGRDRAALTPGPTIEPNRTLNADGLPSEGRSEPHQSREIFPPEAFHITRIGANTRAEVHPDLPAQTVWGFNLGGEDLSADPPISPGPVLVMRYGTPTLVRRVNALPPAGQNGGFGVPEVSTHLHNFHSAPDSDGGPCDPVQQRFFFRGQYYDYFYNMQYAGWNSTDTDVTDGVRGNVREAMGFLWYHDHRVDHTAENTYKGLVGPAVLFNAFDTGDESTGLHLPSFPEFDIPLVLADRFFDPATGLLAFDTFNFDGILGNTFLVNGKVQPFFEVDKRRYRFRVLDGGPSRFYELFLTNPDDPGQRIPFFVIANDGNLLPRPIEVLSFRVAVAERVDIIVDFAKIAQRFGNPAQIVLENRLEQVNERGPTGKILPAGEGDQLLEFRLTGGAVADGSFDPEPVASPTVRAAADDAVFAPIALPDIGDVTPRLTRTFRFERGNGGWQINGQFMDCTRFRFRPQLDTAERWIIQNKSGGWQHPIHVHCEEFRILSRNGRPVGPGDVEFARKDVMQLRENEEIEILARFRDFRGGYPIHCHNTVHEDHQMMMIWEIADAGDNLTRP
jgi:FtsP/CotA-like multicopper oxidase with cupredoxin domain